MPLSVARGLLLKWSAVVAGEKKGWLAAGNVMTHLMFLLCCYSWFVKGTWRVSYCTGTAREKLSCRCSETNISPFQGHPPSAALHFQDSLLKVQALEGYCSALAFSKALPQLRCQINKTEAEHLEAREAGVFRTEVRKSERFVQKEARSLSRTQNTSSPWSTGAVRQTSLICLLKEFSHSCFFVICVCRGGQRRMLLFSNEAGRKEYRSVPSGPKLFLYCVFPSTCNNDHTHRVLLLSAGAGEALQARQSETHNFRAYHKCNCQARGSTDQRCWFEDLQGGQ